MNQKVFKTREEKEKKKKKKKIFKREFFFSPSSFLYIFITEDTESQYNKVYSTYNLKRIMLDNRKNSIYIAKKYN